MKKEQKFLNWVNETFKPENSKYPVAVENQGEFLITSDAYAVWPGQSLTGPVIDYYGEFDGQGYPWIHPEIREKAKKMGLVLEWENAGCVGVYRD